MEFEFDKEMDALLRQATRSGEITSNTDFDSHLDADEISIFAENALPEKAKPRVMKHLADCDRCRTILTNTIALNKDAQEEVAPSAVSASRNEVSSVEGVPWYKKLFGTANLAYGMGVLVIAFAGMLGFLVVQNVFDTGSEVAKQTETNDSVANTFDGDLAETKSDTANSNLSTNRPEMDSVEPTTLSDAKTGDRIDENVPSGPQAGDNDDVVLDSKPGYDGRTKNEAKSKDDLGTQEENDSKKRADLRSQESRDRSIRNKQKVAKPNEKYGEVLSERAPPPPPPAPRKTAKLPRIMRKTAPKPTPRARRNDDELAAGASVGNRKAREKRAPEPIVTIEAESADKSSSSSRKKINGKTFTRRSGVWYDSQYRGQKTTRVRKSSSAYRKLDSGLRTIVSKLGGTVVIVWKSKAYRIQ